MKGIVFTEFFDLVCQTYGEEVLDNVLDSCDLDSGGAYTSVGTYDHKELLEIVKMLAVHTGVSQTDLIKQYGAHLFFRFHDLMPVFFETPKNAFEFLDTVHGKIHVEVKKLYPDAVLPDFETSKIGENALEMLYTSYCPFADFAEGLIRGCINFYEENISLEAFDDRYDDGRYSRRFVLTRQ